MNIKKTNPSNMVLGSGNVQQNTTEKKPTFVGGIIRDITRPVAKYVSDLGRAKDAFGALGSVLAGDMEGASQQVTDIGKAKQSDYYGPLRATGMTEDGEFMPTGEATKDFVGQGLQLASLAPLGGSATTVGKGALASIKGVTPTVAKTGGNLAQKILGSTTGRSATEAGLGTLLSSTGTQLEDDGKINVGKTILDTALGTTFGAGLGLAPTLISRSVRLPETTRDVISRTFKPSEYFEDLVNKATQEYGTLAEAVKKDPRIGKQLSETSDLVQSFAPIKDLNENTFGLNERGQDSKNKALFHIATNLLSDIRKSNISPKKIDSFVAKNINNDYKNSLMDMRDKAVDEISKGFGIDSLMTPEQLIDESFELAYKKGSIPLGAEDALKTLKTKVSEYVKQNSNKKDGGKLTISQLVDLVRNTSKIEFDTQTSIEKGALRSLLREFRHLVQDEVQIASGKLGKNELGDMYKFINSELETAIDAELILSKIINDTTANKLFSSHLVGLLSGAISGNPVFYGVGKIIASMFSDNVDNFLFNKATDKPILEAVGNARNKQLSDLFGGRFTETIGKSKQNIAEKNATKFNSYVDDYFGVNVKQPEETIKRRKTQAEKAKKKTYKEATKGRAKRLRDKIKEQSKQ